MRVPKFLKVIVSVLIVIVLIRAVNGAGELSINSILNRLTGFNFDFSRVAHLFEEFRSGAFSAGFVGWDSDLDFFNNFANVIVSFFQTIVNVIKSVVLALWNVLTEFFRLLLEVLLLVADICGFSGLPVVQ